jgi:hypothetical protein
MGFQFRGREYMAWMSPHPRRHSLARQHPTVSHPLHTPLLPQRTTPLIRDTDSGEGPDIRLCPWTKTSWQRRPRCSMLHPLLPRPNSPALFVKPTDPIYPRHRNATRMYSDTRPKYDDPTRRQRRISGTRRSTIPPRQHRPTRNKSTLDDGLPCRWVSTRWI